MELKNGTVKSRAGAPNHKFCYGFISNEINGKSLLSMCKSLKHHKGGHLCNWTDHLIVGGSSTCSSQDKTSQDIFCFVSPPEPRRLISMRLLKAQSLFHDRRNWIFFNLQKFRVETARSDYFWKLKKNPHPSPSKRLNCCSLTHPRLTNFILFVFNFLIACRDLFNNHNIK
jgi:hypothetical protein